MMNQNQRTLHNFLVCLRFFFLKSATKISNLIVIVGLPLLWAVVSMVLMQSSEQEVPFGPEGKMISSLIFSASGILFFGTFFASSMSLPVSLSLDRIHRRLKIYRTMGIGQHTYVLANIVSLFIIYFPIFLIQLFVINFAFKFNFSAGIFFSLILINIVGFLTACLFGIFFSTLSKTDKGSYAVNLIVIIPSFLFTGVFLPSFIFDSHLVGLEHGIEWVGRTKQGDYSWFKFVQFLSPIGTGIYLTQKLIILDAVNVSLFSWDVDWIGIALQIGLGTFFYFSCVKQFKWK